MVVKKRELYDAQEYEVKMTTMIEKLRQQKPGVLVGMVGKNEVLLQKRIELKKLIDDGYTVAQIVEAMKNGVFSILPKTITEILNNKQKRLRITKKIIGEVKKPALASQAIEQKSTDALDKATFTPRKMDLNNL